MIASLLSIFNLFGEASTNLVRQHNHVKQEHNKRCRESKASVYIVGGGCGDPDLLTVKAVKAIQQADVILVDWLVNPEIYHYFPKNAERVFVGKKCGQHSMTQDKICALMLSLAQSGKTVVRLKGGDPSIFGRLAEETDILAEHDIPFCVIPGVTAASGCAAYAGIPLTHRDVAQSVKYVTAHLKNADEEANWQELACTHDTLVFYMGLNRVASIASNLIKHGMRADMPLALIDQGTLNNQCEWIGDLEQARDLDTNAFTGPALIMVGEVIAHRYTVDKTMLQELSATHYVL